MTSKWYHFRTNLSSYLIFLISINLTPHPPQAVPLLPQEKAYIKKQPLTLCGSYIFIKNIWNKITLDWSHHLATQSRVISLHSWYLTSLVNLLFLNIFPSIHSNSFSVHNIHHISISNSLKRDHSADELFTNLECVNISRLLPPSLFLVDHLKCSLDSPFLKGVCFSNLLVILPMKNMKNSFFVSFVFWFCKCFQPQFVKLWRLFDGLIFSS